MSVLTKQQRKAAKNKVLGRHVLPSEIQKLKNRFPLDARKVLELRAHDKNGEVPAYAWPGGYPIFYVIQTIGNPYSQATDVCCPSCANTREHLASDDGVVDYDINWEDPDMFCSSCNERIESAYAEDGERS